MSEQTPRALPVHRTDYREAFSNPEQIITVRVLGHLSEDGYGIGGRLTHAVDENGNPYPIVGLDPGLVRPCPICGRKVYIPVAIKTAAVACPYAGCEGNLSTRPEFGDEQFEDSPGVWTAGHPDTTCSEHGDRSCFAPVEVPR